MPNLFRGGAIGYYRTSQRGKGRHMAGVGSGLRWEGKAVASGAQKEAKLEMTTTRLCAPPATAGAGVIERGIVLFWFRPAPGTGEGRQKLDG